VEGRENQALSSSPLHYAERGPYHDADPAYDSVEGQRDNKNNNKKQSGSTAQSGAPTYAAVDKSKKTKTGGEDSTYAAVDMSKVWLRFV
jgi:hypothetical protein